MKEIKLFKVSDLIVVAVVITVALGLFIPSLIKSDSLTATVIVEGKATEVIDLNNVTNPYTLEPKDGTVIEVKKGKIRFSSAECRDKLCVKSGWLEKNGHTAACLPEKIVISINGGSGSPDMLTY